MSGMSGCGGKQAPLALAVSRPRYSSVSWARCCVCVGGGGDGARLLHNRDWLTEKPMSITCAHQQHECVLLVRVPEVHGRASGHATSPGVVRPADRCLNGESLVLKPDGRTQLEEQRPFLVANGLVGRISGEASRGRQGGARQPETHPSALCGTRLGQASTLGRACANAARQLSFRATSVAAPAPQRSTARDGVAVRRSSA